MSTAEQLEKESLPGTSGPREQRDVAWAALVALGLALVWSIPVSTAKSWGWDESMHAELPAARMLVGVQNHEFRAAIDTLLDCSQYPFAYPVLLAAAQSVFGISEKVCRVTGTALWGLALFGLYLLVREVLDKMAAARGQRSRGDRLAPWLAMSLAALSPLALAYSGTLFLEVPFTCASIFALRAWLRRGADLDPRVAHRRELCAGAWIALCLFTKFNYGLLLCLGLFADWLVEGLVEFRSGRSTAFARRSGWLAAIPLIVCAWWFVLPLPAGFAVGTGHRAVLIEFLRGNRDLEPTSFAKRSVYAILFFTLTARLFALQTLALLSSAVWLRWAGVRCLWIALVCMALPIELHPFHLDRFLIPCGAMIWPLCAIGLARVLPERSVLRVCTIGLLIGATLAFPDRDRQATYAVIAPKEWLASAATNPSVSELQLATLAEWRDLSGGRALPTAGLLRDEMDALLDRIAREVGPAERVGYLGMSNELSPAALHIGLLLRGGSKQRFLRDAHQPMDITYFGIDPGWSDAVLLEFASGFDVILATEPPDLKNRPGRGFITRYRERLLALGFEAKDLGQVAISRPLNAPLSVTLFACRPKR